MSRIYRTEVGAHDKHGSAECRLRFVVVVEIPDKVISASGHNSPRLQVKAYEVAMDATRLERVNDPNIAFRGWSNSVLVDANPADFGEPSYTAPDGCQAWITEKP